MNQTFKEKLSTASFMWKQTDGFDNSLPAAFKVSHSYSVTVKASAVRNNSGALGNASTATEPVVPGQTYVAQASSSYTSNDTPPISWTQSATEMDSNPQPGQLGQFQVTRLVGAKSSVYAEAYAGTGGFITVSSSAKINTTELKLIPSP